MNIQEIYDTYIKPSTVPMPRTLAELVVKSLENHWFVEADSRKPYKIKEIFELCGNLHADIQYYNGERRIIRINNHYRDEPI